MKTNIMKHILNIIKAYVIVALNYFKRKEISVIPKDTHYCYTPDWELNKDLVDNMSYSIIPCPYYKYVSSRIRVCKFDNYVEVDGFMLYDQCKTCGIND